MENKYQHVVPEGDRWAIKEEGSENFTNIYETKEEAVIRAREIARNQKCELFVHSLQGKVEFRSSYATEIYPAKW